ncbi:SprB repeat-containing protein, partial [Flavobacterium sp. ANB]|nr:SprB repeat-containing protein [Flavobacterium sp. ANB]
QTGNTVNVTGLVPGTYTVQITDDITGCTATASITVTQPTPVVLSLVSNTNANCNFGARVTVSAAGGTPAYKYAFVQSGATPVAADYDTVSSVVLDPTVNTAWDAYVLDANNCPAVYSFTIATDALPTIDTPATPYCYMGGPVPITITGTYVGVPMYSIGNNYQSSPNFVLNAPGTYTFSIRDGNGCVTSTAYELKQQLLLKATLTQDYTCAGDASITLLATQGTLTYNTFEVSYNNGAYTAVTVQPYTTNVPGTYTFRVTDSQGCQATSVSVEVTPRTTPTATATKNDVSCTGGSDGSIVVTAANGLAPYQYQLDGGTFQTSNIFTGLAAGAHNIVVKDAKECVTITLPVTISEPTALAATATVTTALSCGTGNSTQAA